MGYLIGAFLAAGVPGPYNLILRWGEGSPIAIRYDNQERCDAAAVSAWAQGNDPIIDGKQIKADAAVSGGNRPYAFCIPA